MPSLLKNGSQERVVAGADGCRGGWIVVLLELTARRARAEIRRTFAEIYDEWAGKAAAMIVDMPIGLSDKGRRACETMARRRLRAGRAGSVFPSPRRPMLDFARYEEANAWGKAAGPEAGGGLSKQAWNILPRIREIDAVISPADQAWLGEGHPEVAFSRLNDGAPCRHSKKTGEGRRERLALLRRGGFPAAPALLAQAKARFRAAVQPDDILDACALALTAEARLDGRALRLTDGARDARGLVMEIWG
ncbi:DUF429 domain-containing protein [Amphiplicatus metriothermophilus]|uniref:Predicted nuclease (RNAse H fold) n=1 Tax=Amphiplicatus metriothermophilus TaxID=1519374 RepID=A0A239PPD7_9PROT|nr:DUF429 domain-containing protein [Amphiplicatus metriothermophilus]MBB5518674.1 putative RNase H-like nuclease [Amphiplicatus metriothermophilus]SNT72169.1 Predicted nuclease (RNAse H fold) [Amphiplicatus metriothermophilus]